MFINKEHFVILDSEDFVESLHYYKGGEVNLNGEFVYNLFDAFDQGKGFTIKEIPSGLFFGTITCQEDKFNRDDLLTSEHKLELTKGNKITINYTGLPDWEDAPEWATCRAMDEDGQWNWYSSEPTPVDCNDRLNCGMFRCTGGSHASEPCKIKGWKEAIVFRPKD